MKNRLTLLLALFFCTGCALRLAAQGITVNPGTYFTISGSANVTVAGNLSSSGTVANSGTLNVSGNWLNTGTATVAGTVNLSSDNLTVSGQTIFTEANLNDSSGAQQVVTDANAGSTPSDFGNLTVSSTNGVSLGSNLYASQSLTLGSELLTTNTYSMNLGAGSTTSNTTGYVLGNLQIAFNTGAQSFNFIVGTANGYSPATVAFDNVSSAGNLTVNATQTYEPHAPVPSEALNRYWTLAAGGGLAYDYFNTTLNYLSIDFNGSPFVQATMEATMRGAAYDPAWNYPTVGTRIATDGATGSIQLLNITSTGNFTTVEPCPGLTAPTAGNASACGPSTVAISATVGGGFTVNWYDSPTGGTLLLAGSSSFTTPIISTTTVYYAETEDNTNGCTSATRTAVTAAINSCGGANTWLGTSTTWTDNSNWSNGTPPSGLCTEVVSIPTPGGTTQEPVLTGPESVGNLSLGSGASINLDRFNLNVCGNVTGGSGATDGDVLATGGGILVLNGSSLQQISGKVQVQNIQIDNTGGAQLQAGSQLDIYGALQLEAGQFDASNGTTTLKSTSVTQAAIIDNFSNVSFVGTYTGNVTAERYYAAPTTTNSYNQHEMGSPVNTPALSQFGASGTPGYVTDANCDGTRLDNGSPYGNVFGYDETNGAHCGIEQWKVLTSGNAVNGAGYSIRSGGPGTLSLTGAPNITGNVTLTGTNSGWTNSTLQGYPEQSGWTLASNPYPATLQISAGSLTNNVDAGFDGVGVMVWNTTGGSAGSYQLTTTLAPFQAFMVHKTNAGGSATYTIYASDRATTANTFYKEAIASTLNITATNQSTGLIDNTTVGFNSNVISGFDPNFDVHKIAGDLDRHSLYTVGNGEWLYQNVNQSIEQTPTVPMGLSPGVSGTYSFTFDGIASFDATSYITMEDKQLGVIHDVRSGAYTFTSNTSDNWNRFILHFTPPAQILTSDATCEAPGMINIEQPGAANWNYTVMDVNNVTIAIGMLNAGAPVSVSVNAGVYTLTLIDNKGYTVVKSVEVSGVQPVLSAFTVSATTAQVQQNITFNGGADNASVYNWDFGDGATANGLQATHSYQSGGIYTAKLTVTGSSGCIAATSQVITVTSRSVTGITDLSGNKLNIWSYDNTVFVDFSKVDNVDAEVQLYNVLGQMLSDERFGKSTLYSKELTNLDAAYIIVKVINNGEIMTRKVFISNTDR